MTCDEQKAKALGELGPIGANQCCSWHGSWWFFVFERVCPLAVDCSTLQESAQRLSANLEGGIFWRKAIPAARAERGQGVG